ncbi:PEP-CTERM sorting domain-containing protein [Methylophilus sp. UBA6697]|uniref:PEP-CTERM sorting domain-containing protein n=1 Tax=Methylophilus sp. UBA6697 TaxID=1946902 RepID=UPI0025E76B82|nr:PEP-CTERM sorting domain-containing protein [Methylophilus sp. UBA6697]
MKAQYLSIAIGATLFAITGLAQANTTYSSFVDVADSVSFDGWNQLNRNRVDSNGAANPLTAAQLAAGTAGNVVGSGDALLTQVSGSYYPAGFGLYGDGNLTFTDNTVASNISALAFQGIVNDFNASFGGEAYTITLSYNGGSQAIAGTLVNFVNTGTVDDYYYYSWDLSGVSTPITSYTLNFSAGFSQALAFQVDQVASVSSVPEADSYAMMMLGLGVMGAVVRRRNK